MNEIKNATHLTRDHYGFFHFWPAEPKGLLRDDEGNYKKDDKGRNISGVHNNADISDLGLKCTGENLALIIAGNEYDVFRDSATHEIVTEAGCKGGPEIPNAAVKAVVRYEAKFGVREWVKK